MDELLSEFGREVDQKVRIHDRELFLVEFPHRDFVLVRTTRHDPRHVPRLVMQHRMKVEQVRLPIMRIGTTRREHDMVIRRRTARTASTTSLPYP